ncbi:MAG: hypothetical protein ACREU3_17660, partial [Steroidobacteraceae bacterium]
ALSGHDAAVDGNENLLVHGVLLGCAFLGFEAARKPRTRRRSADGVAGRRGVEAAGLSMRAE